MSNYPVCSETILCGTPTPVVNYPFYINLYRNSAENNRLDKTKYLKLQYRVKGTLRNSCSLVNPIINLEVDPIIIDSICVECNYCYIEEFNRYYFIDDIISVNKSLWELHLSVDVLMSYLNEVKNTNALILRNQFKYNPYIEDTNIFLEHKEDIKEYIPNHIPIKSNNIANKGSQNQYINNEGKVINKSDYNDNYVYTFKFNEGFYKTITISSSFYLSFGNNVDMVSWSLCDTFDNVLKKGTIYKGQTKRVNYADVISIPYNAEKLYFMCDTNNYTIIIDDSISFKPDLSGSHNIVLYSINNKLNLYGSNSKSYSPVKCLPVVNFNVTDKISVAYPFVITPNVLTSLAGRIKIDDVSKSYIVSTTVYPFDIPIETSSGKPRTEPITLGDKTFEDLFYHIPTHRQSPYFLNKRFKIESKYHSFLDYNPYSKYEIFIPYANWIEVDPQLVLDKELYLMYVVNYTDSTSYYILATDDNVICSGSANLGDDISISSTNKLEIDAAKAANNTNARLEGMSSIISGGIGATISTAMHNPVGGVLGIASGVMGAYSSVKKSEMANKQLFVKAQNTITSGSYGLYNSQEIRVKITRLVPIDYNDNYNRLYGRPLNETHFINEMSGYTVIGDFHLENFNTATKRETEMISQELSKGIII